MFRRVDLLHAHGSAYLYRHGGCRCSACCSANSEYQREWRDFHPESVKATNARSRHDPAKVVEYRRRWYAAHREKAAEKVRNYRAAHREECNARDRTKRARKRAAPGTHTAADVAAQRTRQKGRCYWCHEKTGRHYHVDHVVPLVLGGSNGPENCVISCAFCNQSKHSTHPMDFAGVMF